MESSDDGSMSSKWDSAPSMKLGVVRGDTAEIPHRNTQASEGESLLGVVAHHFTNTSLIDGDMDSLAEELGGPDVEPEYTMDDLPSIGVSISWRGITYGPPSKDKQLQGVTGFAAAGRLHALLGGSGAGKTTLLDLLSDRLNRKHWTGEVRANGRPISDTSSNLIAYTQVTDALYGDLTVANNLFYAAKLRLPSSMSDDELWVEVDRVIELLGLGTARDTPVGSVFRRGVSGGQRKRAGIGLQLITNPKVLLLDEPTTGLDSTGATEVVARIKKWAREQNRTVIMAVQQPTSSTFLLFDDCTLLTRGRVAYTGSVKGSLEYFAGHGLPVPLMSNPADYYLSVLNFDFSGTNEEPAEVRKLITDFPESAQGKRVTAFVDHVNSPEWNDRTADAMRMQVKWTNTFFHHFVVLWKRGTFLAIRNPAVFWARALLYIALALFMGVIFLQLEHTQQELGDRISSLFFGVAFVVFMSISAVPAMLQDVNVFVRERVNSNYHVGSWVLANFFVMLPFMVVLSVLFSTSFYWLANLRAGGFGTYIVITFFSLLLGENFMGAVSAVAPTFIIGVAVGAGFYGLLMCLMGFLVPVANLPTGWIWANYLAFHKYLFEALMVNEFGSSDAYPCIPAPVMGGANGTTLLGYTPFCAFPQGAGTVDAELTGDEILQAFDYDDVSIGAWIAVSAAYVVAFRILMYVFLRLLRRGRR